MRIAIHTQYYLPEIGAPQARLSELANFLSENGVEVIIITSMPNYPIGKVFNGYGGVYNHEVIDNIKIIRCFIYPSNSKRIIPRIFNYFSFAISSLVIGLCSLPKCDYIISESPPLFIGYSGLILSKIKRAKWIFNISDLWPESALAIGVINRGFLYSSSRMLEEYLYRKAYLITGQSKEIVKNIKGRMSNKKVIRFSNGVNIKKFHKRNSSDILKKWSNGKRYVAVYAGLHGLAQGLDQILLAAEILQENKLDLQIIFVGEGLEKEKMIHLSQSLNLKNVTFVESQEKQLMPAIWASADIALICLKKYILGAVPSKLYEAMASSSPIIMIGSGEPKKIVESANCGYTIEPGQIDSIASCISNLVKDEKYRLLASNNARDYVVKKFNRKRIMKNLLKELIINENS